MRIPMIVDLQIANKFKLTYHQLKGIQNELLMILDFDLMALTPHHFLTQLFASGVVFSCDSKANSKDFTERTFAKLKEYAFFFCDAATEAYEIVQQYSPAKVALACVYLARKCCKFTNCWTVQLEEYTQFKLS